MHVSTFSLHSSHCVAREKRNFCFHGSFGFCITLTRELLLIWQFAVNCLLLTHTYRFFLLLSGAIHKHINHAIAKELVYPHRKVIVLAKDQVNKAQLEHPDPRVRKLKKKKNSSSSRKKLVGIKMGAWVTRQICARREKNNGSWLNENRIVEQHCRKRRWWLTHRASFIVNNIRHVLCWYVFEKERRGVRAVLGPAGKAPITRIKTKGGIVSGLLGAVIAGSRLSVRLFHFVWKNSPLTHSTRQNKNRDKFRCYRWFHDQQSSDTFGNGRESRQFQSF